VRPRLRFAAVFLSLVLALVLPREGLAQEQEASASFSDQVSVGWVMVPVIVRSGAGYARNLDREDFRLSVDGQPVTFTDFERRSDAPASLLILQDLSGSMASRLSASRHVVRFFLDNSLPGDEFAMATFAGDDLSVDVPFTAESSVLAEAAERWEAWGATALHDAVAWMPEISFDSKNPKRFAILVTDGQDNASRMTPEEARAIVQAAQLPTYVIGLGSGDPYSLATNGDKIYRYADVLSLLAAVTGGRYFDVSGPDDLKEALKAILDDVRHQYVLGFATGPGSSKFRTLRVEVKGSDRRTVVFRRGYKGTPPARGKPGG
jgi:VWFA-related protein